MRAFAEPLERRRLLASLVADILPGIDASDPQELTECGGILYFTADDGQHGRELWRSDGSAAGTRMIQDIRPGAEGSGIGFLTALGSRVYFRANDGVHGDGLWWYDSADGQCHQMDFSPGPGGLAPKDLMGSLGQLYFAARGSEQAGWEPWCHVPSIGYRAALGDLMPGPGSSDPRDFTRAAGRVFFTAVDGTSTRGLWSTDGTPYGTAKVNAGFTANYDDPRELLSLGDYLYFTAQDAAGGRELWRGNSLGAGQVVDLRPGALGSNPVGLTVLDGVLYFLADRDGDSSLDLFRSDGTAVGTSMVKAVHAGAQEMVAARDLLFFQVDNALWRSDGTADGTYLIKAGFAASLLNLAAVGNLLLFAGQTGPQGHELWRSDGTAEGTYKLSPLARPSRITDVDGRAFMNGFVASSGYELWVEDATTRDDYEDNDSKAITDSRPAGGVHSPNFGPIDEDVEISWLSTLDDPTDWYRFSTYGPGGLGDCVEINICGTSDLDLVVYREDGVTEVRRSAGASAVERVSLDGQPAGTYHAMVYGAGALNYTLKLLVPEIPKDVFEDNNRPEDAKDLGVLGDSLERGLSIHDPADVDYFRFRAAGDGAATIAAISSDPYGSGLDLALEALDHPGNPIGSVQRIDDRVMLTATLEGGKDYRLLVSGHNNALVSDYDLSIDGPGAQIKGTKWSDLNGNGTRDEGEPALAGWTIFLDGNGNGTLDPGERSTLTDADGNYTFTDLDFRTYTVAEVQQPGWTQTSPTVEKMGPESRVGERLSQAPAVAMDSTGNALVVWQSEENGSYEIRASRYTLTGGWGNDFIVNSMTADDQMSPAVAMDSTGNALIVWFSRDNGGDGEIRACRYSASGILGRDFIVNSTTAGGQSYPAVAMDSAGNALVVWHSYEKGSWEIRACRYSASGVLGQDFIVNSRRAGDQSYSAVAMDSAGNALVVWNSEENGSCEIRACRYSSSGVLGNDFTVNNTVTEDYAKPAVAMNGDGNALVVWDSEESNRSKIRARRYNPSGASGDDFTVPNAMTYAQINPAVAMDSAGNALVVWDSLEKGDYEIRACRYSSSGVLGNDFIVNSTTAGGQGPSAVAMDSAGNGLVVWDSLSDSNYEIRACCYTHASGPGKDFIVNSTLATFAVPAVAVDSAGNALVVWNSVENGSYEIRASRYSLSSGWGNDFIVNTRTVGDQTHPAVAMDSAGNALVVWGSYENESGWEIRARHYTPSGFWGDDFVVNSTPAGDQMFPAVAMDTDGNAIVVWDSHEKDSSYEIHARRFSPPDGWGDESIVNSTTATTASEQGSSAVAMDRAGNALMVWHSIGSRGYEIRACYYTPSGGWGNHFIVSSTTADEQEWPSVAMDSAGNALVAWMSIENGIWEIRARRYTPSGPVGNDFVVNSTTAACKFPAVAMDSAGNAIVVWEPLEIESNRLVIRARRYTPSGPLGDDFIVSNAMVAGDQYAPAVADIAGNALVVWHDTSGPAVPVRSVRQVGGPHVIDASQGLVTGADFGSVPPATISGWVWEDANGDGQRIDEPGLPWFVFLDSNGNGAIDGGEQIRFADANGYFEFAGLPMGIYQVAQLLPPGWTQTCPDSPWVLYLHGSDITIAGFGDQLPQSPYPAGAHAVPGLIQAEDFDQGGERVAYHDLDPANIGGAYRPLERVDVQDCTDEGGGYNVGWANAGEWLEYTVDVLDGGMYQLLLRAAMDAAAGPYTLVHLAIDGKDVTGPMPIYPTGDWRTYQVFASQHFWLPGGTHVLRLQIDQTGTLGYGPNIDWLALVSPQNPYKYHAAGGLIQAEDFDEGGQFFAYFDIDDDINYGGAVYRTGGVDMEPTLDLGGGLDVGWFLAPEWLEYTVYVELEDDYSLEFRVASDIGAQFAYGFEQSMQVLDIAPTGGWQSWQTLRSESLRLSPGMHVLHIEMVGGAMNLNWIRLRADGEPFNGIPFSVPGLIQAEEYDWGANGGAYCDDSPGNAPSDLYRKGDDVDIEYCEDIGGTYNIGNIRPGEWLSYTIDVLQAGDYDLEFRVAHPGAGGIFQVDIDGMPVAESIAVPDTGGWQAYQTLTRTAVALEAGEHVMRLFFNSAGQDGLVGNLNWIRITPHHTPYPGSPIAIPGRIEAENYDWGANGIAYGDADAMNNGFGDYRSWQDVDIRPVAAGETGGQQVGWVVPGEWLDYTIDVPVAGLYDIGLRVACGGPGGQMHLEFLKEGGPTRQTPWLAIPDTGGWDAWQTLRMPMMVLEAGVQVMRVHFDAAGPTGLVGDLNWIDIQSSPDEFRFSAGLYSAAEASGGITVTVERIGGLAGASSVRYRTAGITAAPGSDYVAVSGVLHFALGESSRTFFLPILDDTAAEADETLRLMLEDPSTGASLGIPATATLSIVDDDLPSISIEDASAAEGDSGEISVNVTVRLSAPCTRQVAVDLAPADGTAIAPGDYYADSLHILFDPGQVSQKIEVWFKGDTLYELDEAFQLNLSGPVNASIARGQATITVLNDDPMPTISIDDPPAILEGDSGRQGVSFRVYLSAPSGVPVTVHYATADGTATAPADYTAIPSASLRFEPGQTEQLITVLVNGDPIFEGNECFYLNLDSATGAFIVDPQARSVITDDDPLSGTSGPDKIRVQLDEGGGHILIVVNEFTHEMALGDLDRLLILGGGGDDELTIDPINGWPAPAGGLSFLGEQDNDTLILAGLPPGTSGDGMVFGGGDGADTLIVPGSGEDDTFTLSGVEFTWGGANVSHSGIEEAHISGGGGDDGLSLIAFSPIPLPRPLFDGGEGNDTLTLTGSLPVPIAEPVFYGGAGTDSFEMVDAQYTIPCSAFHEIERIAILGQSVAVIESPMVIPCVVLHRGQIQLAPGGGNLMQTGELQIQNQGTLDLADNALVITGTAETCQKAYNDAVAWVRSARNQPVPWSGPGITTSAATTCPPEMRGLTGLAVLLNKDGGSPILTALGDYRPTVNDVIVMYTWNGDANLSGTVDGSDYLLIDRGYLAQAGGYHNGDLDYSGQIDGDDYFLIDSAFLGQQGVLPNAIVPQVFAAAPIASAAAEENGDLGVLLQQAPERITQFDRTTCSAPRVIALAPQETASTELRPAWSFLFSTEPILELI